MTLGIMGKHDSDSVTKGISNLALETTVPALALASTAPLLKSAAPAATASQDVREIIKVSVFHCFPGTLCLGLGTTQM
jgi:hypothetical protein